MITKHNLKDLLTYLGYKEISDGKYRYDFEIFNCSIEVDFGIEKIEYPKELIVNEKQTCNFTDNENFVVLECVHRLLKKGYKPSHIELERRWSLGHSQKSGRADICVMNENGTATLFIIECKTYGEEYTKALNTLKQDGGQLFSYAQQEKSTKWICLYASDYNNKIKYNIESIFVFDSIEKIKEQKSDKSIMLFENANTKEDLFRVWKNTYEEKLCNDVIFSNETVAYNIGEKPLRKKDLKEFNPDDKIVNQFEEILRHNNVSDKENAFNRLVALFICKLVDELSKTDDDIVEFQYKIGTDTYESLQDRLQRLYKKGMEEFLKEDVFYVESEYPTKLFSIYKGVNRKHAIEDLKQTFKKLKFYSNNEFAFKDVHNEVLFNQNGKILVEVVQLFEKYKIVYDSKHQFLGDLFEQLLNKGFKQNEGQFFTPMPITRFIWESLPLENIIKTDKGKHYPYIIDYACGSGHFLTEGIDIINKLMNNENNDWVSQSIYGIEKDYRLARVSKISLFMNGAGGGNIIFGDGLENDSSKGIENGKFDILVANPPYSVKAFKSHLKLENNDFELLDRISNDGGEIEVLFVERIAQLVKPNGIAAVILPSSILSNTSNSYIGAREVLLKNFQINAITQFSTKTFGATGTNTVALFLKKYDEPPKKHEMIQDSILNIFNEEDVREWGDKEIFDEYIKHIGVEKDVYISFIKANEEYQYFSTNNYFKMYVDSFDNSAMAKNIKKKKISKRYSEEDKAQELKQKFYSYAKNIEQDKMFYFALTKDSKTLIVTAPTDNVGQKEFLGYDWSNRKGSEGIQITKLGGMLFDENNRESKEHISTIIRNTFYNDLNQVGDSIEKYINLLKTKTMFDFERDLFNKSIRLSAKYVIESKYKLFKLSDICLFIRNGKDVNQNDSNGKLKVSRIETISSERFDFNAVKYTNDNVSDEFFWRKGDIALSHINSLKHLGKTAYFDSDEELIHGINILRLRVDEEKVVSKYFYLITKLPYFKQEVIRLCKRAVNQASISVNDLSTIEIPVPPINIQEKIISEYDKLEKKYETTRMKIEEYKNQIQEIFQELEVVEKIGNGGGYRLVKLVDICNIIAGRDKPKDFLSYRNELYKYPIYGNGIENKGLLGYSKDHLIDGESITISARGTIGHIEYRNEKYLPVVRLIVLTFKAKDYDTKYLYYALKNKNIGNTGSVIPQLTVPYVGNIQVVLPTIEKQRKIVVRVEKIEKEIEKLNNSQIDLQKEISSVIKNIIE